MKYENLSETVLIKTVSETEREGIFEIEGLYTGYGVTLGNALRRVLFSSLPGAAITQAKIKGISHEFTAQEGIMEDTVEIALNLKRVRFRLHSDEPQVLSLKFKGEGEVTAREIETNSQVEVITPDEHIATLTSKSAELDMELTVEKGLGYVPAEAGKADKLAIGVIALDAIFSPVIKVNFSVDNMRVADRTDYNRAIISIETDGSITPSKALKNSIEILRAHFDKINSLEVKETIPADKAAKPKKFPAKKRVAKKKE